GLDAFTEENARDAKLMALASKVRYEVDPANPYPDEYTGHVRVTLDDGRVFEERQPYLRGGHHEPLTRDEIEAKFRANARFGGWSDAQAEHWLAMARRAFDSGIDLNEFRA